MGDEETVKLEYKSPFDPNFHGKIETYIPVSEWAEMSVRGRNDVVTDTLYRLVHLWPSN